MIAQNMGLAMPTATYQETYSSALRRDARGRPPSLRQGDRVYVKNPNVEGGGYWRSLPGRGRPEAPEPARGGGYLKSAALLFGGAAAGGAIGVLATKWASKDKIAQAVDSARKSAQVEAQQEIDEVRQEVNKLSKTAEKLKTKHQQESAKLKKLHDDELKSLQDERDAKVSDLEKKLTQKEGEAATATAEVSRLSELKDAYKKQLDDKVAEHKEAIASLQKTHAAEVDKLQKDFEKRVGVEVEAKTFARRMELEAEHSDRLQALQSQMAETLKNKQKEFEDEANRKALETLTKERQSIMDEAQLKIREATEPKAKKAGQLIDDDKVGIHLSASIRQGYDHTKSPENVRRNISDAVKRVTGRQVEQAMQGLGSEFKDHARSIHLDSNKKWNQKWDALKTALEQQGQRETILMEGVADIQASALAKYNEAFAKFDGSDESAKEFDKKAQAIHKQMLKEIGDHVSYVKERNPLDTPIMGRKRGDSEVKIYARVGG